MLGFIVRLTEVLEVGASLLPGGRTLSAILRIVQPYDNHGVFQRNASGKAHEEPFEDETPIPLSFIPNRSTQLLLLDLLDCRFRRLLVP